MRRILAGWLAVVVASAACVAHAVPIAGAVPAASADQDACKNGKDRMTAIQACTALISLSANDPAAASDAYLRRAALLGPANADQALDDLAQAIKLQPRDVKALQFRALIYMIRNNTDGAMADLNQAIAVAPNDDHSYIGRAALKQRLGDVSGAVADYGEAIRLQPQNADYYGMRS